MTNSAAAADQIDLLLAAAVDRDEVPGVAALAADTNGVTYSGASGTRKGDDSWTADSVIWLASMSKMIVCIGALQLVEQGKLDLDAPLGALLPQLDKLQVLEGFDDAGHPLLRPAAAPVTLRKLMSHTAGNGYHFWDANVLRYQQTHGLPSMIECRESTLTTPLVFDPGTAWEYGTNIDWVGKAVEKASGFSLEDYLRQYALDPLGMKDTSFVLSADRRTRLAGMYARTSDGLVPIEFEVTQEPEFFMGGGGMYGSPADYLTLLRMLLANGTLNGVQILRPDSITEAMRNQIGELTIGKFTSVDPVSSYDVDFLPGTTKKWGLLGMINMEETPGGRSAGSLFWAGLCNSYFWVDWNKGNAGVICTQILPFADPQVLALFDQFENAARTL
jgi:CubicO group peptidase (beta-lactamase class C family)